jgi:hypothetical protein
VATRAGAGSSEETQVIGRIPTTRAGTNGEVQLAKAKATAPAAGRATARSSGRSSVRLENGGGRRSTDTDDNGSHGKLPAASSAEATIILPIPRGQWARGSNDRNGGN